MASLQIPAWQLYGEVAAFPDILHVEQVVDRAAGLDWTIAPHRHLHLHQIFLLSSGDIALTLDGEKQAITPPVIINIPRGTVHGFCFSAGTIGYVVTLPAHDFPDLFAAPAETAAALSRIFTLPADATLTLRFDALALAQGRNAAFRRTLLRAELAALLAQVLEKEQDIYQDRRPLDPRIQRFQTLLRDQPSLRLSDLAKALALSARHLSRLCKEQTGLPAQSYIEAQKMREACRLLVYTRMSAQAIGWQLGFDDPAYFSRVFQRNLHQSPRAYRVRFDGNSPSSP